MSLTSFHIITYGCQMNQYDSDVIANKLQSMGLKKTDIPEDAELVLVNTCSVREHAEIRAEGRLRSLCGGIGNIKKVGVVGCMAQRIGRELIDDIPGLDFAIGPDQIDVIAEIISEDIPNGAFLGNNDYTGSGNYTKANGAISAFVAISRGCDNFCKYCIVPFVRGRLRSRSNDDIIAEIAGLAEGNAKEITLLGQNVNAYNYQGVGFAKLLKMVAEIDGIERIRFTTSHPKDLTIDIIEAIAGIYKVAPSIHLPVQSGSTAILEAMGRGYKRLDYIKLIDELKTNIDNISITSDILVGFPNETDEDYEQTVSLIEEVPYSGLFCFKYSPRPGTEAEKMEDNIPDEVKLARLEKVIDMGQDKARLYSKAQIGRILKVMVEGQSKKNANLIRGYAENTRIVEFEAAENLIAGDITSVEITSATTWTLFGRQIKT